MSSTIFFTNFVYFNKVAGNRITALIKVFTI
jgi:hypothetical protein